MQGLVAGRRAETKALAGHRGTPRLRAPLASQTGTLPLVSRIVQKIGAVGLDKKAPPDGDGARRKGQTYFRAASLCPW